MSLVRFLMLLSLVVWVGGITFFAFVLAPTVFHPGILPSRQLAGAVVSRSLGILHWIGLGSGMVFLVTSTVDSQVVNGVPDFFSARNLLVCAMIVLTLISMFAISTRMLDLRSQMVFIDDVPRNDARRVEFNLLHVWSTRVEGAVLLLGLAVIFLDLAAFIIEGRLQSKYMFYMPECPRMATTERGRVMPYPIDIVPGFANIRLFAG